MVIVTDFIIMTISHKVPASNTLKSASTYESLCLHKNHSYILDSLGVECQFWNVQVLIYMFGILFFKTSWLISYPSAKKIPNIRTRTCQNWPSTPSAWKPHSSTWERRNQNPNRLLEAGRWKQAAVGTALRVTPKWSWGGAATTPPTNG